MPQENSILHQLPSGTLLNGKYEIIRSIGEGGFGITYIGHNKVLDIPVAIKEFYPKGYANRNIHQDLTVSIIDSTRNAYFDKWKMKFLTEARMLAKFASLPGIVNVHDFFEQNGTAYIVMEYLDGITLKNHVEENGPMETTAFFKSLIPVLKSLAKIHEQGLIHRDISPDNLMLMDDGFLKLYDFGAAREYSDATQSNYSVIIKPHFAPEEQYRSKGRQGPWTDVYSICATIYFSITGVVPDDSLERVYRDELKRPSDLGIDIPTKIEAVLLKGMSVRSSDRYDSVIPLVNAFEEADNKPVKKKGLGKAKKDKWNKQLNIFSLFRTSSRQVQSVTPSRPVSEHIDDKTEIVPNTEYEPNELHLNNSVDNEIKKRPKPDSASTPLPSLVVNSNAVHKEQAAPSDNISAAADPDRSAQIIQETPEDLDPKRNKENWAGIVCPKCKTVLPSKAKFCGRCGIPLQSYKTPANNSTPPSADKLITKNLQDIKREEAVKNNSITCPKCKTLLPPSARFCGMCGVKLSTITTNSGT